MRRFRPWRRVWAKKFAQAALRGLTQGKKDLGITSLPKSFKEKLLSEYEDECIAVQSTFVSSDGTENIFPPGGQQSRRRRADEIQYGYTQCVSTQVGCRMGCKFCASTLGGLVRNLTAGEILADPAVNALHKEAGTGKRAVTNVVLMGSGEPLDNYDETIKFLRNVTAEEGLNVSARNISLSTCGLVPKMYALANEGIPVNLTVSLHATDDGERRRVMPVAKAYPIAEILKACAYYFERTGRRYYFEYTLIEGENCDEEHARALVSLLKGKPCHVNLIRLNEVKERELRATGEKEAYRFLGLLEKGGLRRRCGGRSVRTSAARAVSFGRAGWKRG
ncbi:MAG: 23S rRNA (adenine(2503)-C(2))-methyltransferase RlmN [Christensenellaceae bacterium]